MKELSDGFEEDGFTPEEVKALRAYGRLRAIRGILRGTHEVKAIDHMIDLSVPCKLPFVGAERVSPAKSGVVKLEPQGKGLTVDDKMINLFLSEEQKSGVIVGHELRKELEAKGGNLSASILDHLVAYPALWPESWKKDDQGNTIYVCFWDDIFRGLADGILYVRCGYWRGGEVVSSYDWLGNDWRRYNPSASLA